MSEKRKRKSNLPRLIAKNLASLIALALILIFGSATIKFCLGLFMTGDYIVTLPGGASPVLYRTEASNTGSGEDESRVHTAQADITVAGDLMTHMPIITGSQTDDGYSFDSTFSYVSPYLLGADFAVANLETTLSGTDSGNAYGDFNAPDALADAVKTAGFDMMLTGNEHCNDYGTFGLKRTLDVLANRELGALGTRNNTSDTKYTIRDIGGIQIGMICYTYAEIGDTQDQPTVNSHQLDSNAAGLLNAFDYDDLDTFYSEMGAQIESMKADGAEAIVLFIHWGNEFTAQVNTNQTAIAQKMCDLGVDVIAGSHPHVVQEVALLTSTTDPEHQTFCAYSLGNFLSNQRADNSTLSTGQSEDGAVLSFTFARYSDGRVFLNSVDMLYTWVLVRDGETYQILPLDDNVDWKTVYGLDKDQLAAAKESYSRTESVLSASLRDVVSTLRQAKADRDTAYTEAAVG